MRVSGPPTARTTASTSARHALTSRDRLILIRGAAGTGKMTMTHALLEQVSVPWVILAPSPSADGRNARHQVFGVQLIDADKRLVFVPYGAIIWGEGRFNGERFSFLFAKGDQLWEAVIEGTVTAL